MSNKQKSVTVRATWPDGLRMMFGTSYRTWDDQLAEYCRTYRKCRPSIEISDHPWISYGGLKWCSWESFQEQLDKEGKGRVVSEFPFRLPDRKESAIVNKMFEHLEQVTR